MKFGLPESVIEKINTVLSCYEQVEEAILYGSRAKGTQKNGSDIDLTLRGTTELTQFVLFRILEDLDDLLLPYTIDLSVYADIADPELTEHIQRVGVEFYKKIKAVTPACR